MILNFNLTTEIRRSSNDQVSNLGERIAAELRDPTTGVPTSDRVMRILADDIAEQTVHFGLRVRMDRSSAFTDRKKAHEKARDEYVAAIRRGLKNILREPVQTCPPARREAAMQLQELLDKRSKNFEDQAAGENSTQLKYLFEDFDSTPAQAALKETDLLRFYGPLKEAQAQFSQVVREQEAAEAKEKALPPAQNPKNLPKLRVIRQTLTDRLRLAMENLDLLAEKGLEPYVVLAVRCAQIVTEAGVLAKGRQTREGKKAATAQLDN